MKYQIKFFMYLLNVCCGNKLETTEKVSKCIYLDKIAMQIKLL